MSHNPTEHAQEHLTHEAAHGHGPKWITAAATTAAIIAAFAAVTGALATRHLTESTQNRIDSNNIRIKANDNWNFYQAKSIKSSVIDTRMQVWNITPVDQRQPITKQHDDDVNKLAEYSLPPEKEKDPDNPKGMISIQKKALEYEEESKALEGLSGKHLEAHETYEMAATMFHIAIAVVAIAVVAKRKEFWYISMVGGAVGVYFFVTALRHAPAGEKHTEAGNEAAHVTTHAAVRPAHEVPTSHESPTSHEAPASSIVPAAHESP